jgi:hypothetical protein
MKKVISYPGYPLAMVSKPEKRVRTEDSMGPRGFGKTLKCVKRK